VTSQTDSRVIILPMKTILQALGILPVLLSQLCAMGAEQSLTVHEWGTFTSLQDEMGEAIGGINTDDEPVPQFVRRLADRFLLSPSEAPPVFFQGAPKCHPDVTMRLETPVIYFYATAGWKPQRIDVRVAFRGGWLTEFYPGAEAKAPGFDAERPDRLFTLQDQDAQRYLSPPRFGHLPADVQGELSWKGVALGADGAGPETKEKVWLAPRAVQSSMLQTAHGEREKFLFYRGVGSARATLRVVRKGEPKMLEIRDQTSSLANAAAPDADLIPAAWLAEVRADGSCAFRSLGPLSAGSKPRATLPAVFAADEFSANHLSRLQNEMRSALVAAGLFVDEVEALLRTWEVSYFKSPGLRLFYVCTPREIERLLPLHISVKCHLVRVMIGRIEIVTPEQRALLAKIAAGPALELATMRGVTADSQSEFFQNPDNVRRWESVMAGKSPYRELGLAIPEIYAAYLQLGRFRNALLLDEEKRRPTPALRDYIHKNGFAACEVE